MNFAPGLRLQLVLVAVLEYFLVRVQLHLELGQVAAVSYAELWD